jgi:hypothetical protein
LRTDHRFGEITSTKRAVSVNIIMLPYLCACSKYMCVIHAPCKRYIQEAHVGRVRRGLIFIFQPSYHLGVSSDRRVVVYIH